jgi:type IV pilus assembly protein PilP
MTDKGLGQTMPNKQTGTEQSPIRSTERSRMKAWVPLLALSAMLSACAGDEGDDLDQFMRDAGKGLQGKVDPLPEVKPYEPAIYNADAALNDPFKPRKAQIKPGGLQPNLNRPREALEAFPRDSLQLVGILRQGKLKIALLRTPDNNVQQVRIGNYLGQDLGMVVDIIEGPPGEVKIKEIVQDDLTGQWSERPASIIQPEKQS